MNHLDMMVSDEVMCQVLECCAEWGIMASNSTINGMHRFWGNTEDLHVLKISFG